MEHRGGFGTTPARVDEASVTRHPAIAHTFARLCVLRGLRVK